MYMFHIIRIIWLPHPFLLQDHFIPLLPQDPSLPLSLTSLLYRIIELLWHPHPPRLLALTSLFIHEIDHPPQIIHVTMDFIPQIVHHRDRRYCFFVLKNALQDLVQLLEFCLLVDVYSSSHRHHLHREQVPLFLGRV
jgi:hypothetical protein